MQPTSNRPKVGEWTTILILAAAVAVTTLYAVILLIDNGVSDDIKALIVVLIGVVSAAILQHTLTKRRELAAGQLAQKRAAYEQMIETALDIFFRSPEETSTHQREALFRSKVNAAIWADRDLLMWWSRLNEIDAASLRNEEALPLLEELLGLIRRELGKKDSTLQNRELASMFATSDRQGRPNLDERG